MSPFEANSQPLSECPKCLPPRVQLVEAASKEPQAGKGERDKAEDQYQYERQDQIDRLDEDQTEELQSWMSADVRQDVHKCPHHSKCRII
mmetsp:Transcript_62498/g.109242  ORF Transcript_62498/g.109242 Transcript_62498/m.109242 type:complete len:90 (-) Transcript_62498:266-535(-)